MVLLTEDQLASLPSEGSPFSELFAFVALGAAERDRERILPFDVIDRIRHTRLGALRIPMADGGGGKTIRELLEVVIPLAAADSNVAHILRNHFVIVDRLLLSPRSHRNQQWLQAVVQGAIFGFAGTELDAKRSGSLEVINTKLTREGLGYRLDGEKYYSTGSLYADYFAVQLLTPNGRAGSAIIPTQRQGIERVDDWDGFGQRLTGTGTTRFHQVRVEADELILDTDPDYHGLDYISTLPQLYVTAINAGIVQAVLEDATALVQQRTRTFYHAVSEQAVDDPLLQQIVGRIASDAFAAQAIVLAAADALDRFVSLHYEAQNSDDPQVKTLQQQSLTASLAAAKAKLLIDELAQRSATLLFEVGGASTTKRTLNLDRHWRNARTLSSHNPSCFKARALGDYHINGTLPPNQGFF